jgi:cation transporter-like permease
MFLSFFDKYILMEVLFLSATLACMSKVFEWQDVNFQELLFNNLVNGLVTGQLMLIATKRVVFFAIRFRLDPDNVVSFDVCDL